MYRTMKDFRIMMEHTHCELKGTNKVIICTLPNEGNEVLNQSTWAVFWWQDRHHQQNDELVIY